MTSVRQWLDSLGLGQYAEVFEANDIDEEILADLTLEDLATLGVDSLGHRKKLLKAISTLDSAATPPLSPSAQLESAAPRAIPTGEAERRQLTVMFCDLVGSTAMATRFDPEELQDLIRAFQDRCAAAIAQFDGYIARYMGDGMLVYFGFPRAHEDDPERAVRAGLEVVSAIGDLNRDIEPGSTVDLAVRVGIATGMVVVGNIVGEGAAAESTVVGEAPNLAARLQGIAQPNQVVIGSITHDLLAGRFELEDLDRQTLKGISESVAAWRVVSEKNVEPGSAPDPAARSVPLVGRQEEFGLLLRAWESS